MLGNIYFKVEESRGRLGWHPWSHHKTWDAAVAEVKSAQTIFKSLKPTFRIVKIEVLETF